VGMSETKKNLQYSRRKYEFIEKKLTNLAKKTDDKR
jgi:hypothetical protein